MLTGRLQQLFALLTGLLTQFVDLSLCFLTDRDCIDELLTLLLSLLNDFVRLMLGSGDEIISFLEELVSLCDLVGQGFANRIQQFNGVLFIDEPPTTEWDAAALKQNFFQLIQLVKNWEPHLAHHILAGKGKLKSLARSSATTSGTMWLTGPPKRATSLTTELLRKLW